MASLFSQTVKAACLDESFSDPLFPNKLERKHAPEESSLMRSVESICY